MPELFTAMVKEEWRLHSSIFGTASFVMFPVLVFAISAMGTYLLPLFRTVLPAREIAVIVHGNFLLLGIMVGAFGLLGNEVMNRRFGQVSLLASAARSLPLTDRFIFVNFVVKDTVYYFFLWVFPFVAGFSVAAPFAGIPLSYAAILVLTLSAAFLTGLSGIFFLSAVYVRSRLLLALILGGIAVAGLVLFRVSAADLVWLFPPLALFRSFSWNVLLLTSGAILLLFGCSFLLFTPEFSGTARRYGNIFSPLELRLRRLPDSPLVAKDLIDLWRSGSVAGQTIFSFVIPLALIWFFLSALGGLLPAGGIFLQFGLLTGIIASTMYTWLTQFDSFATYSHLPLGVGTVIASKVSSFTILQVIPVLFLLAVSLLAGTAGVLVPAIVLCLPVSYYALAVTVYMTGLSPAVLLYDARVLLSYLVFIGLPVLLAGGIAMISPAAPFATILLLVPAWLVFRKGVSRWERREPQGIA